MYLHAQGPSGLCTPLRVDAEGYVMLRIYPAMVTDAMVGAAMEAFELTDGNYGHSDMRRALEAAFKVPT